MSAVATTPTVKVVMIDERELAAFFGERGSGGSSFEKAYPDAIGLVSFSRVGFDAARTQALVFHRIARGGGEGSGGFVLLTKTPSGWSPIGWSSPIYF